MKFREKAKKYELGGINLRNIFGTNSICSVIVKTTQKDHLLSPEEHLEDVVEYHCCENGCNK